MKKNFKKTKEKQSIRRQINRFTFVIMGVVLTVLFVYYVLNLITIDKYNSALHNYSSLSDFYKRLEIANGNFKDYLYTQSEASFKKYEDNVDISYKNLEQLEGSVEKNQMWRISLLHNMLDSYVEQAKQTKTIFLKNKVDYERQYSDLLEAFNLIIKTGDDYYTLLTDEMEMQSVNLNLIKRNSAIISTLIAAIFLIWLFYFTYRTMQLITKPLGDIVKNLYRVKRGEYDLTSISNTGSEMHELCAALDEMADAVQKEIVMMKTNAQLEKKLLESENESLRKDEMLAQSEVKMLQNQINPHFLFNTLNMTYRLALQEHAYRCSEMIERTSALLRYGLDKQNKLSDLKSEISALENYIAIQEKRLGDRVHFELHVDDDLPNISIPGMIIQPLIENSLKHGLKDCVEEGEIITAFRYEEEYIYILVSDNGEGMDSALIEQMQLHHFHDEKGEHLGLYNVAKRLEMFFRENVDISVNSAIGCGFEFVIKIGVDAYETT